MTLGGLISEDNLAFNPSGETIICLLIVLVLIVLFIVVGVQAKHADPTKKPRGLLFVADWAIEKIDGFTADNMGVGFENFGGILLPIICFLFLNMIIGITGLPTPMVYLPVPLSLGLVTFFMIHATSIRYSKLGYFRRYIDPFPIFLPINLLSMWAPLLSLTLRLLGNALVGWVLMTLVNWGLSNASAAILQVASIGGPSDMLLIPFLTPVLHAYFDAFSAFIQTLVFVYLTALFVAQEKPEVEDDLTLASRKEINAND